MTRSAAAHFRAHDRRPVRLPVDLVSPGSGGERRAVVVDISLAGAGLLTEEPLVPGERVSLAFATPTLWDPLVVMAVVAWARPLVPGTDRRIAPQGTRSRLTSRAGVAFDHAEPPAVLALFEMLSTLVYE